MSSLPDKSDFSGAQVASATQPQKIVNYIRPAKNNGWLVRNYATSATAAERTTELAADPYKYRDWAPERDPGRRGVTLPVVKWMGRTA